MFTKKFTVIISFFLIIAIGVGGMLGYYDARLEAAVTPKKQSMDKVKIKNEEDLTFDKDVVNILLVGSDNGAQGSEKGDHGRSDSMMVAPRHHTLLVQLLDCRHAPSADDEQMLRYLHYHQIPYVVALTKADKLKKRQLAKTQEDFENLCRPYGCQKVVLTSGENGYGIPELQAVLNAAVAAGEQEAE